MDGEHDDFDVSQKGGVSGRERDATLLCTLSILNGYPPMMLGRRTRGARGGGPVSGARRPRAGGPAGVRLKRPPSATRTAEQREQAEAAAEVAAEEEELLLGCI